MQGFFKKIVAFRAVKSLLIVVFITTLSACTTTAEDMYKKYNMSQSDINQLEAIDAEITKRKNTIHINNRVASMENELQIDKLNLKSHKIAEKYNIIEVWSPLIMLGRKQTTERALKTEKNLVEERKRQKLAALKKAKLEKEQRERARLAKIQEAKARKQRLARRSQSTKKSGGTDWGEIFVSGLAVMAGVGALTYGAAKIRGDSARSGRNLQRFECKQKCIKEANNDMEKECSNPSSEFIKTLKNAGSSVAASCGVMNGKETQNVFKNQCHNYCYN